MPIRLRIVALFALAGLLALPLADLTLAGHDPWAALARMGGALSEDDRQRVTAAFLRECTTLCRANHPNILPFFGIVLDGARQPVYMATALVRSGSLQVSIFAMALCAARLGPAPLAAHQITMSLCASTHSPFSSSSWYVRLPVHVEWHLMPKWLLDRCASSLMPLPLSKMPWAKVMLAGMP